MTFEEFWADVEELGVLPDMAIKHIPSALSDKTKKKLMKVGAHETVRILIDAIEQINHGSIESVDEILKTRF